MMRIGLLTLMVLCMAGFAAAQDHELKGTPAVYKELKKLHRGLRVLYIAAHPDDENTRLISWLENDQYIETAYLSLTRGQGGQNLIGDEKGDALGVIRTYELLEARKVDGGEQFFTRAVDFGYSKSAAESFEKWGRDEVLSDMVFVIRKFRPHVIITRFPPSNNAGHGHHEASAILAAEAFDMAGRKDAFPAQLQHVQPWQPISLYFNASSWWMKELDDKTPEELEAEKIHRLNIGVFDPLSGLGINEIASLARSKHRCQAFGTSRDRGERFEYLQWVKGEWHLDLFESMAGIWERSPEHKEAFAQVIEAYDFVNPDADLTLVNNHVLPKLAQRSLWADPQDMAWVNARVNEVRADLMGVRVEIYAGEEAVVTGSTYPVTVEVYNAGSKPFGISFRHPVDTSVQVDAGKSLKWNETFVAPATLSNPYWLREPHGNLYVVKDPALFALPEEPGLQVDYTVIPEGASLPGVTTLHRRWTDRSVGEIEKPMLFVPAAAMEMKASSLAVPVGKEITFELEVHAFRDLSKAVLGHQAPEGWEVSYRQEASPLAKGQLRTFSVTVKPTAAAKAGVLSFNVALGEDQTNWQMTPIRYEHIPDQTLFAPAAIKVVPLNLEAAGGLVLYIEGSGDEVDESLELLGYQVHRKPLSSLSPEALASYKAVVCGIRAFNTNDELAVYRPMLLDYVEQGGIWIVQYNTTSANDPKTKNIGPYPLELGRSRVTEEDAVAHLLDSKHPVLRHPHRIGSEDFEGWVQERGLYFASTWDEHYKPLIGWRDAGDKDDALGGLLVAEHGQGAFIYTGISFFRQLPAGVPGAYRLFVNMIEYQPNGRSAE